MTTFVLIAGAWNGGWVWKRATPRLRAAGHDVYTPTLTGLGERQHLAHPEIDLDTHIQDVVNVLGFEELEDVVLVGHSYGGMVIAGVADRAAERLAHLVYLDAAVPRDGESFFGKAPPEYRAVVEEQARAGGDGWRWPLPDPDQLAQYSSLAGFTDADRRWFRAKAVPHPIKTMAQPVRLTNPAAAAIRRTYIRCPVGTDGRRLPDYPEVEHARNAPDWQYRELPTGHWPMISTPGELAQLLLDIG
jgi:pimeloyl-ACP methyl ester carboxylesterase